MAGRLGSRLAGGSLLVEGSLVVEDSHLAEGSDPEEGSSKVVVSICCDSVVATPLSSLGDGRWTQLGSSRESVTQVLAELAGLISRLPQKKKGTELGCFTCWGA